MIEKDDNRTKHVSKKREVAQSVEAKWVREENGDRVNVA